jgi:tetratricopeptide (TPR) repeat protein
MRTNDYEEAYKYSLESVKTNEKDSMSCYTHGIILLQRNEVDAGIKYLKKAIELD